MNNLTVNYPKDKLKIIKNSVVNKKLTRKSNKLSDVIDFFPIQYLTQQKID